MSHQRSCRHTSITAENAKKKDLKTKLKQKSLVYFPPLSLSVYSLTLSHSFSLSLCLAGLIECLNKLINHWHWWKTDRPGEVMFIKLPPICFFNPCSRLFAEYAHIPPFPEISLPRPRLTVHTLIHYL